MAASVPTCSSSSYSIRWEPTRGWSTTMVALTVIRIVGTARNHPEFVWIPFEHRGPRARERTGTVPAMVPGTPG